MDIRRLNMPVRKRALHEAEPDDYAALSPAERLAMVWELTQACWSFMGERVYESRLPRHALRVVRFRRSVPAGGSVRHGSPPAAAGDLWGEPSRDNAPRIISALQAFGAPMHDITERDFSVPDRVVQLGVPPGRIDLMTSIDGVKFEDAWPRRMIIHLEARAIPVLGRHDLLENKRATDRPKDRLDVSELEAMPPG